MWLSPVQTLATPSGCSLWRPLLLSACLLAACASAIKASPDARHSLDSVPAWFEPVPASEQAQGRFFSRGASGSILIQDRGARFATRHASLDLTFRNAHPAAFEGVGALPSRSSYFLGNDPRLWKQGVPHFAGVRASGVYPGVDVFFYTKGTAIEFDFEIAPGADPGMIRLAFGGAGRPVLDSQGDLVFAGGLRQRRPVAYQITPEGRLPVEAAYRLASNGDVVFSLGAYDASRKLIIDPILHAGYLGGDREEIARAITVDADGVVWVAGSSGSEFIVHGQPEPIQFAPNGRRDVFLAKLVPDEAGKPQLAYWTVFGGSGSDEAFAIASAPGGFVYLAGYTASADFPRAGNPLQDSFGGATDAFVAIVRPADAGFDALWYSQFYGDERDETAYALAVDAEGNIYAAGSTTSGALPGAAGPVVQGANRGGTEGFLFKVVPNASPALAYSTFFGGKSTDAILALSLDPSGDVYVAGYTSSDDFPVTFDGYQVEMRSSLEAFLVRLDLRIPGLDALLYGTYLGGDALDVVRAMIPAENGVWLAGYTMSSDFPTTPDAHRRELAGGADAFLVRFDYDRRTTPEALRYATYLGGRSDDVPYGLARGPQGAIAVTGYTYSDDFPLVGSPPPTPKASPNAEVFVSLIDPARGGGAALTYSTVFGGGYADVAAGIAADAAGHLYVAGFSQSSDFPVTDESRKATPGGSTQSFVVKTAPAGN